MNQIYNKTNTVNSILRNWFRNPERKLKDSS